MTTSTLTHYDFTAKRKFLTYPMINWMPSLVVRTLWMVKRWLVVQMNGFASEPFLVSDNILKLTDPPCWVDLIEQTCSVHL